MNKIMFGFLFIGSLLFLHCATTMPGKKFVTVERGMTQQKVAALLGKPTDKMLSGEREIWYYYVRTTAGFVRAKYIIFIEGKVNEIGDDKLRQRELESEDIHYRPGFLTGVSNYFSGFSSYNHYDYTSNNSEYHTSVVKKEKMVIIADEKKDTRPVENQDSPRKSREKEDRREVREHATERHKDRWNNHSESKRTQYNSERRSGPNNNTSGRENNRRPETRNDRRK